MGSWWQLFEDEFNRAATDFLMKGEGELSMNMNEAQESHELVSWFAGLSMSTKRSLRASLDRYARAEVDPLFNMNASNGTDYIGDEMELKLSRKEPEMNSEQRERVNRAIQIKQWVQADGLEAVLKAVFMGVSAAYGEGDYEAGRDRKYARVLECLMQARWNSEGL